MKQEILNRIGIDLRRMLLGIYMGILKEGQLREVERSSLSIALEGR